MSNTNQSSWHLKCSHYPTIPLPSKCSACSRDHKHRISHCMTLTEPTTCAFAAGCSSLLPHPCVLHLIILLKMFLIKTEVLIVFSQDNNIPYSVLLYSVSASLLHDQRCRVDLSSTSPQHGQVASCHFCLLAIWVPIAQKPVKGFAHHILYNTDGEDMLSSAPQSTVSNPFTDSMSFLAW